MKKISLIALTLFYVVASAGIDLKVHFCGGKFESISFNKDTEHKGCCEKRSRKDCCKTGQLSIKITDSQEQLVKVNTPLVSSSSQHIFYSTPFNQISLGSQIIVLRTKSSPPIWAMDLHILHGVFLI